MRIILILQRLFFDRYLLSEPNDDVLGIEYLIIRATHKPAVNVVGQFESVL